MNCVNTKISEMPGIHQLLPNDIFPIVHKGENRVVIAAQLVDLIAHIIGRKPGIDPEILDMLRQAREIAEQAAANALEALRKACDALSLAKRAYAMYTELDARVDALEQDVYVLKKLANAVALLERELKYLTERVEKLENMELEIRSTTTEDGYIAYTLYKDGVAQSGTILVPTKLSQLENDEDFIKRTDLNDLKFRPGAFGNSSITYSPAGAEKTVYVPNKLKYLEDVDGELDPQQNDMLIFNGTKWVKVTPEELADILIQYILNNDNFKNALLWKRELVNGKQTLKPKKADDDDISTLGEIFSGTPQS